MADGQREVKRRAFVRLAFGPDAPAMAGDDAVDDRQADAGAFEIVGAMQALEHAEEFLRVALVEADAVVADEVHRLAVDRCSRS